MNPVKYDNPQRVIGCFLSVLSCVLDIQVIHLPFNSYGINVLDKRGVNLRKDEPYCRIVFTMSGIFCSCPLLLTSEQKQNISKAAGYASGILCS